MFINTVLFCLGFEIHTGIKVTIKKKLFMPHPKLRVGESPKKFYGKEKEKNINKVEQGQGNA